MALIVTGAAGFIGSNLVRALNERGERDIIAVDNLSRADKVANLRDLEIADFVDKRDFLRRLDSGTYDGKVAAVLHQGACSDTMESDGRYMMENNYEYSMALLRWCRAKSVRLIYASSASVYGAGREFREAREHEAPLNVYGYSKFLFDQVVRRELPRMNLQLAGFRYFNVYGPREAHKARMASVAFHFFNQYARLHLGRRRGAGEPLLPRQPARLGHLQRGHRPRAELQRGRRGHRERGARPPR